MYIYICIYIYIFIFTKLDSYDIILTKLDNYYTYISLSIYIYIYTYINETRRAPEAPAQEHEAMILYASGNKNNKQQTHLTKQSYTDQPTDNRKLRNTIT